MCTGDLVRLRPGSWSNIKVSPNFKKLANNNVQNGEFVLSEALLSDIKLMNSEARKAGVTLMLNQTLRDQAVAPSGAVVTPAKRSQHYIGHALDLNIVDGSNWNNTAAFKSNTATASAKAFIKAVKAAGLHWGGDFSRIDSPHFDRQRLATSFDYEAKYFFYQRALAKQHMIPLVI